MEIVSLFHSHKHTLHRTSPSVVIISNHALSALLFCIVNNYQCFMILIKLNCILLISSKTKLDIKKNLRYSFVDFFILQEQPNQFLVKLIYK